MSIILFKSKTEISENVKSIEEQIFRKKSREEIFNSLVDYFNKETTLINQVNRGLAKKKDVEVQIEEFLKPYNLEKSVITEMKKEFESYVWGYWKLDPLIKDPDISDIKILAPGNTRIKVKGKRMNSNVTFKTAAEIEKFATSIATKNDTSLAIINAIQSITDKNTSEDFILRINLSTSFVNSVSHPYIHIRKIPKKKRNLEELQNAGMFTEEEKKELESDMANGMSVIMCGKGASGKTTLINALLDLIPEDKSGLVIQESEELFSYTHPDLMFQRVRKNVGEGNINYTLKDLSINGLLIDIDYFIIGEIKGDEAIDFINASYTGSVVLASIHSNNSKECPNKLVHYMKYASEFKKNELLEMMKDLDKIYFLKDFEIKEITEIAGYDDEKEDLIYNTTFLNHKRINPSCKKIIEKKSR